MEALDEHIRRRGRFLRRRDLLRHGYTDDDIRCCLEAGIVFRVRHGWYSTPDAPPEAVRAVRIGGRLTGVSALESYGRAFPAAIARTSLSALVLAGYASRRTDANVSNWTTRCACTGPIGWRRIARSGGFPLTTRC